MPGPIRCNHWCARRRRWEEPSWTWREFVALAGGPGIDGASELHLVPVNPRCPHCAGHLARALAESRAQGGVRVEALIVDTPKPPAAAAFASVAVDGWWWDARDTWR